MLKFSVPKGCSSLHIAPDCQDLSSILGSTKLDALILNAGVLNLQKATTKQGPSQMLELAKVVGGHCCGNLLGKFFFDGIFESFGHSFIFCFSHFLSQWFR